MRFWTTVVQTIIMLSKTSNINSRPQIITFRSKLTTKEKINNNETTYILKKQLAEVKYHLKWLNFSSFNSAINPIVVNQVQWLPLAKIMMQRQKNKWTWQIKLKESNDKKKWSQKINLDYNSYPNTHSNSSSNGSHERSFSLEICSVWLSMTTSRM